MSTSVANSVCLVTGATGFVGTELVAALLQAGMGPERLRCLVRDPAAARARGIPAGSIRTGDIRDASSVRAAAAGSDLVVHLAGTLKAPRRAHYFATNRAGSENVAAAVATAAPGAFVVVVSSLAAAGPSVDGSGSDRAPAECRPVSAYGESKRQGELALVTACRHWAIVRPPVVYGPGDAATRLLFAQARAPLCLVPPRARPLSIVHVRDVVAALLATIERRPHGAVLPLDGAERTDTHALMRAIGAACGRTPRLLPVPLPVAAAAASVADLFAAVSGRSSFFNGDKVRELRADGWVADATAARQKLDWRPTVALADGLAEVARREGFAPGSGSARA